MPAMNVFDNNDAFSMASLTAAVNAVPYRPGQVSAAGLFDEDGVTTLDVLVEHRDGKLGLVEPTERGGAGETVDSEKRSMQSFRVPHYERNDLIKADEVQGVRAFGSETELEVLTDRVNRKAQRHAADLTMTLEHQRIGAIKGVVASKSGAVLANLYTAYNIAVPASVSLVLGTDTTDVGSIFQDVVYSIEDSLDEPYEGIHVFTGRDLHRQMWRHKSVRDTFLYGNGAGVLRQDVPDTFEFGGATWERYKTGAKATADLGAPYIAANEARVVVKGVQDLFLTRFAPADYEETVNTVGLPFYAQQYAMQNKKGRHLEVQMNAISLCTRPQVLRRLTIA